MNNKRLKLITAIQALMALLFAGSLVFVLLYFIDTNNSQKNLATLSEDIKNIRQTVQYNDQPTEFPSKQTELHVLTAQPIGRTANVIPSFTQEKKQQSLFYNKFTQRRLLSSHINQSSSRAQVGLLPSENPPAAQETLANLPLPNPMLAAYRALHERNEDFAGWIYMKDTVVDYPVMYTPDEPEKYIHKNFDGDYSRAGLPFMDIGSQPDSRGVNQIIYGHNMRSGAMFAILHKFYQDDYWNTYRSVSFDTLTLQREYEILALIPVIIGNMDKPSMLIFNALTTQTQESVDEINQYLAHYSKRLTGEVLVGDDLLTLVTCRKLTDSDRLLLVARRPADKTE